MTINKRAINVDLDLMIKRASEKKTNLLKKAEGSTSAKLDALDGHEVKPTTGATAADNKARAGDSSEASVDAGAKDNPENGSVANNTDGSTAASTNGQEGAKGSEIAGTIKDADNGPTDKNKFASAARELAKELRKAASDMLTPLDHFLVKQARSTDDPKVKTAMEAMADDDVAGQASDALMQQLSTGQISDEDAAQILEEALKAGALTPEELEAAAQVVKQHAGGDAAPAAPGGDAPPAPMDGAGPVGDGAAPGGDVPPAAPAAPMDGAASEAPPVPEDVEAKIAAAEIDPSDPKYVEKIGKFYKEAEDAGKQLFAKVAEYLIANEPKADSKPEVKADEAKVAADKEAADKAAADKKVADDKKSDPMSGVNLSPSDDAEKQALAAVKQELGIDDKQLAELAATPLPASNDKVAAAIAQYRVAILTKVAALKK